MPSPQPIATIILVAKKGDQVLVNYREKYPFKGYQEFCGSKLRHHETLEEAAKEKVPGVIFTYVYEKDEDDDFIKKLQERISKHGGEIIFIQIYCEKDELLKRVTNDSRKQFHKVKNPESLGRELEKRDVVSPISIVKSLKIDNTHLSEDETFQKVFELIK